MSMLSLPTITYEISGDSMINLKPISNVEGLGGGT